MARPAHRDEPRPSSPGSAAAARASPTDHLVAVARFVAERPGWAVVAARVARRGGTFFGLLTPSAGAEGRPRWRLVRGPDRRLAVINVAAGAPIGHFASVRDALAAVGEIEARAAATCAAHEAVGGRR